MKTEHAATLLPGDPVWAACAGSPGWGKAVVSRGVGKLTGRVRVVFTGFGGPVLRLPREVEKRWTLDGSCRPKRQAPRVSEGYEAACARKLADLDSTTRGCNLL